MTTRTQSTRQLLADVPSDQKAEIIDGAIVLMSPTGFFPGRASAEIFVSLREYERQHGGGYAIPDNVGFIVDLPNRGSFSPDAAWYIGQPSGMQFVDGAPAFAVEVRSADDYGRRAELELAQKRADYFAAGTLVVWDVDLQSPDVVRDYHSASADRPVVYRRGDRAEAEPSVPGWRFAVDQLFS